jgi:predicted transposase YdaD
MHPQSQTSDFQRVKSKARIEAVAKLRQFGLSDEQIAEVLELPLEVVKQVNLQE